MPIIEAVLENGIFLALQELLYRKIVPTGLHEAAVIPVCRNLAFASANAKLND
jgi:phosphotransferase system  glucose/maltose/N-acetylglucosamine-specific IIC component